MGQRGKITVLGQLKRDGGDAKIDITGINLEMRREDGTAKGMHVMEDFTE